uniref:Uncharacterized protein n=1 Tax=Lotus japonicus TaxID=34305 RepID=I3SII0_LOTJA|nr:unknown [Lotus japonicus]
MKSHQNALQLLRVRIKFWGRVYFLYFLFQDLIPRSAEATQPHPQNPTGTKGRK